ncbi:nucleotidyltransferase [Leucobacter sp. NPDC058333]|uniref:SMODS domain-containing nucleotidyltransferase n=1 Tax=Leucobacter sp. NPDC058333 TaxID=3346450 RepID=UPI0036477802
MTVLDSFDSLQQEVDADPEVVRLARQRRDTFKAALATATDVKVVWGSGSLARSTQLQPVHDVDLVVEFDADEYPEWGSDGDTAEEAIERCRDLVHDLLSVESGTYAQLVRQVNTAERNRAAKCFIDPPGSDDAFTVDVMPALRRTDGILIPFKSERRWTLADPEYLISQVAERQREWAQFRPLVRMLKYWARQHTADTGRVKSLVMEVLALDCLHAGNRPEALKTFFVEASSHSLQIEDPAGLSGVIQPDLDIAGLRRALEDSALAATAALRSVANNDQPGATQHWQDVFGDAFPLVLAPTGEADPGPRPIRDSPQG